MIYLLLAFEFFKTGLFSIGGGLASLPFLEELAHKYDWFTTETLAEMVAVAESTPGPIGINVATYAGYNAAGVLGGIVATFSYILPAFIIVSIAARLLARYNEKSVVQSAFSGLRPAVTALIVAASITILLGALLGGVGLGDGFDALRAAVFSVDWRKLVFLAVAIFAVLKFKAHPILYIACGAAIGILLKLE